MKNSVLRTLVLIFAFVFGAGVLSARAEDLGPVKARMKQRLAKIDELKASGAIGENNRGFVEVRDGGGGAADVVAAENRDREAVYAAIAKQAGSSADRVGRARARHIAAASAPGVWLQREDGGWYKK
jgi:uncharacterized protein YdbL (DUF1318 family)